MATEIMATIQKLIFYKICAAILRDFLVYNVRVRRNN